MAKLPGTDRIVQDIYEALEQTRRGSGRGYLGMSEIGKPCARALWYGFRGFRPVPPSGRGVAIFRLGDRVEEEIVHHLTAAGYSVTDQQLSFSDHQGHFAGHCDGIVHGVTQRPHILEIKSSNDKKFKSFKQSGVATVSPEYFAQAQCYMGYSGLERALFVIMNKNDCSVYTERIHFNQQVFQNYRSRALEIITANEPPETTPHFCDWCNHRLTCNNPEESIMPSDHHCGTCYYFGWDGLIKMCKHPSHNFPLTVWGESCPDYLYLYYHEIPGNEQFPRKVA